MIKIIFVFLIFLAALYLVNISNTITHEQAHIAIGRQHGCINDTIEINYLNMGGKAFCFQHANRSIEYDLNERYLQSMNEIIGYNVSSAINAIAISAMFIFVVILILRKGVE